MLIKEVEKGEGGRIIIMDSITKVKPDHAGAMIVAASHGGASSGEFALAVPLKVVFFNDAGGGKDNAGVAALGILEAKGVPAGTVAHTSARIGDCADMWESGVISNLNSPARDLGLEVGAHLRTVLTEMVSG